MTCWQDVPAQSCVDVREVRHHIYLLRTADGALRSHVAGKAVSCAESKMDEDECLNVFQPKHLQFIHRVSLYE